MIYGYIRTSRAAVDGLAGMHPETQLQVLSDAGVDPTNIVSDVGISGSVPAGDRPGWTCLDARLLRGDTLTVAALDRIRRNRVELVAVVESLHKREVGIASLAPAESWLHPLGAHPTEVEQMMGEIILRVMAWAAQAELESIKRRIEAGVRRAAEEGRFPGRPRALTPDQTAAIRLLRQSGQSQSAGPDLRRLPPDRLARRADGVTARRHSHSIRPQCCPSDRAHLTHPGDERRQLPPQA